MSKEDIQFVEWLGKRFADGLTGYDVKNHKWVNKGWMNDVTTEQMRTHFDLKVLIDKLPKKYQ